MNKIDAVEMHKAVGKSFRYR